MDPEVWRHLTDHEDILRLVLGRVSWDTNVRLRLVSKAWNNTLLDPLTWSSMLKDRSFYIDDPVLKWVDSSTSVESNITRDWQHPCSSTQQERSLAIGNSICILSTTTCAVVNLGTNRWCKLPPIKQLPFGRRNEFTVTGSARGLLLLERNCVPDWDDEQGKVYELDRFLFNPLTQDFSKLPPVPRNPHERECSLEYPIMITVDNDRVIRVVAVELGREHWREHWWKMIRILIWQENGSRGWEAADVDVTERRSFSHSVEELREGVFAAGKLFLNARCMSSLGNWKGGHRVMECNWETHFVLIGDFDPNPIQHLFQHRGVLMRLTGTGREVQPPSLKLCTFDHLNGTWSQESTMELPNQMVNRLYATISHERNTFVHVEGDILCIGNQFRGEVLLLYNLLSRSWTEVCAKYFKNWGGTKRNISLWSPTLYASKDI
ncbi:hypothetical protein R1sor_000476 [Riccia sorocarpa]|uniref:F-box domain-containing protein n=1 Tax=Riccia sorocarpa TaxID=122646 RepID=A0ABD3GVQ5_9MARC